MLKWLSLSSSKYYNWKTRRNTDNKHNNPIPKAHWLLPWEIEKIIDYRRDHMGEGYRRLSYMMLDEDVVAVSPSSVYRVLKNAGLLLKKWRHQKTKGSGFTQPLEPHQHWHLDISYINFKGTFVYLVAFIDGYSRLIVHEEIRTSVEALDIEIMLERAMLRHHPARKPILITDNGPQFIAKEFKNYLQEVGITHRKTRFYYPQSNGKIERFYQTCKNEWERKNSFISLDDLEYQLGKYINYYNYQRLHSSIGYITPFDKLRGNESKIFKERKIKLQRAKENRMNKTAKQKVN
jgi:putative transposase